MKDFDSIPFGDATSITEHPACPPPVTAIMDAEELETAIFEMDEAPESASATATAPRDAEMKPLRDADDSVIGRTQGKAATTWAQAHPEHDIPSGLVCISTPVTPHGVAHFNRNACCLPPDPTPSLTHALAWFRRQTPTDRHEHRIRHGKHRQLLTFAGAAESAEDLMKTGGHVPPVASRTRTTHEKRKQDKKKSKRRSNQRLDKLEFVDEASLGTSRSWAVGDEEEPGLLPRTPSTAITPTSSASEIQERQQWARKIQMMVQAKTRAVSEHHNGNLGGNEAFLVDLHEWARSFTPHGRGSDAFGEDDKVLGDTTQKDELATIVQTVLQFGTSSKTCHHRERLELLSQAAQLFRQVDQFESTFATPKTCSAFVASQLTAGVNDEYTSRLGAIRSWALVNTTLIDACDTIHATLNVPTIKEMAAFHAARVLDVSHDGIAYNFEAVFGWQWNNCFSRGCYVLRINCPGHALSVQSTLDRSNFTLYNNDRAVGWIVMLVHGPAFKSGAISFSCDCSSCDAVGEFQVLDRGSSGKQFASFERFEDAVRSGTDRSGITEFVSRVVNTAWAPLARLTHHPDVVSVVPAHLSLGAKSWAEELTLLQQPLQAMRLPGHVDIFLHLSITPVFATKLALDSLRGRCVEIVDGTPFHEVRLRMQQYQDALTTATRVKTAWKALTLSVAGEGHNPLSSWFEAIEDQFERSLRDTLSDYLAMNEVLVRHVLEGDDLNSPEFLHLCLDKEWAFVRDVATLVDDGEDLTAASFCSAVVQLLRSLSRRFSSEMQDVDQIPSRATFFERVRQHSVKILSFAKHLRSNMEVASEFEAVHPSRLETSLVASGHTLVTHAGGPDEDLVSGMKVYCPHRVAKHDHVEGIVLDLLKCSFGDSSEQIVEEDAYIILIPKGSLPAEDEQQDVVLDPSPSLSFSSLGSRAVQRKFLAV